MFREEAAEEVVQGRQCFVAIKGPWADQVGQPHAIRHELKTMATVAAEMPLYFPS